ncbi:hypothetical protein QP419_03500 [Corynebacterium amycolatum]|uniref:hypothetical protein n=1 Tax=Corynebacterium amycolatum TaxID=43765 RepID=UPI00254C5CA3|nr:hypothetical protein [Corynebacterium amycolatum]MDK7144860.1 hypothetical protein [Corynebacterium amycolatum]
MENFNKPLAAVIALVVVTCLAVAGLLTVVVYQAQDMAQPPGAAREVDTSPGGYATVPAQGTVAPDDAGSL